MCFVVNPISDGAAEKIEVADDTEDFYIIAAFCQKYCHFYSLLS